MCRDSGKDINGIRYFHIYDPISWVREISTKVLQVSKDKILIIFDKYGSLGPSQNFFALIELNEGLDLVTSDLIILFGFGPAATSISFLLSCREIAHSINFISV
ncbi:MAG: hypothetical protein AB8V21_05505 [Arsenophonus endosymbiont of Dermacentor nuttalli]